jgi:hypothetical protein
MITWQDVVNIAPEFDSSIVPAGTQAAILAIVANQIDDTAWGEFADQGRAYLAAHLSAIRGDEGLVTQESLGAMSRSYALPPGIIGSLALSTFGAEYLRLLRIAAGITVFVP